MIWDWDKKDRTQYNDKQGIWWKPHCEENCFKIVAVSRF